MPINLRSIQDSEELFSKLKGIDISVPGRAAGRKTDHTEVWTICRLLSTLAENHLISFPLSVIHNDRPDIRIQLESKKIGVEITEAISQQYAAYCALAEREFPDKFLDPSDFRWGAPDRTTEQMRDLLRQSKLSGAGWEGVDPEKEWAKFILSVVQAKLKKLDHLGFEKFKDNWLAIYDNLPLPYIELNDAISFLRPLLESLWSISPHFDAIFVERGPVIAHITEKVSEHLMLKDLWDKS